MLEQNQWKHSLVSGSMLKKNGVSCNLTNSIISGKMLAFHFCPLACWHLWQENEAEYEHMLSV